MTTHELARYLLAETPDLPVVINGWGSDEGEVYEVTGAFDNGDGKIGLGQGGRITVWSEDSELHSENKDWIMYKDRLGNERIEKYRSRQ